LRYILGAKEVAGLKEGMNLVKMANDFAVRKFSLVY